MSGTANTAFALFEHNNFAKNRVLHRDWSGCRTCLSKRARLRRICGTANTAFASQRTAFYTAQRTAFYTAQRTAFYTAQRTAFYTVVSRLIRGDAVGDAGEFDFACFAAFFGADDVEHAHVLVEIDAS